MPVEEFIVTYVQWLLPTWFLRLGVRFYLRHFGGPKMRGGDVVIKQINVDRYERSKEPVTVMVEEANEQHYGNDPAFFVAHLGPKLKYSACEWPSTANPNGPNDPFKTGCTLGEAEEATLLIYQDKAGLASLPEGSNVLELGCGWGSLTLANAARFPGLRFTAFSNSPQQIEFITGQAPRRSGLGSGLGLEFITGQAPRMSNPAGRSEDCGASEERCRPWSRPGARRPSGLQGGTHTGA